MSTDKSCFLCNSTNTNHSRSIFSSSSSSTTSTKSLANILADILQQTINENAVHSKYLCKKCILLCKNYELLSDRLDSLRTSMILSYNETIEKITTNNELLGPKEECVQVVDYDGSAGATSTIDYAIDDDVNFDEMSNALANDDNSDKLNVTNIRSKNIVLIDPNDMKIFTMSEMNNIVQSEDSQESAFQAVIFEPTEEDEYSENDGDEQYFLTEHLDEAKEYFDSNEDQMIEVSTNDDLMQTNKRTECESYVYQDESNDDTIVDDSQTTDLIISRSMDSNDSQNDMVEVNVENDEKLMNIDKQTIRALTKHKKLDNDNRMLFIRNNMEFKCILCNNDVSYDTKTIAIHLKTDHNERIYVCGLCGKDFQKRNPYNEHMEEHMANANDGNYECDQCNQVFTNMRQYRMHMKTHTISSKIWTCKECNKSYSSKNLLEEHINMHTGER